MNIIVSILFLYSRICFSTFLNVHLLSKAITCFNGKYDCDNMQSKVVCRLDEFILLLFRYDILTFA